MTFRRLWGSQIWQAENKLALSLVAENSQGDVEKSNLLRRYCEFQHLHKAYKLKKTLKNEPENMLIFEDTHEAIISRKLFDVVQKHYEGRKKSDKFGETDKYAGSLYCAGVRFKALPTQSANA